MNASLILLIVMVLFWLGYRYYGGYISRIIGMTDKAETPAQKLRDGVDYEPAPKAVVMGHHFATIAGAGPIVGPILAIYFGWLPALLWIIFGAIFVGAVHDYLSLAASLRHEGRSIGSIIEQQIGVRGKKLFILFSFPALVLVIGVFMNVVVATFIKSPAVGSSSILFVLLAICFGIARNRLHLPLLPATIVGVALMLLCVWAGIAFPISLSATGWTALVTIYIFIAAILPVGWLLQPRDYLNSFLLYGVMIMALFGLFLYQPSMNMPAFSGFEVGGTWMFPILFVTVACGACSGFHSLAASGTTSKQLSCESEAQSIGYGSMLIEGVLAVVALITVAYLTPAEYAAIKSGGPIAIFSSGVGSFASALGIPANIGITFAAMAISSFALTTLDSCVRLARFAFQEFFSTSVADLEKYPVVKNPVTGTALATLSGLALKMSGGWKVIWPLFGAANQLLGALALLAGVLWLEKSGKTSTFAKLPMMGMFAVSLTALAILMVKNMGDGNWLLGGLSGGLLLLGSWLAVLAKNSLQKFKKEAAQKTKAEPELAKQES